jgi:hypothetical protein
LADDRFLEQVLATASESGWILGSRG